MNGTPRVITHPPGIHTLSMDDYQDADGLSTTGARKLLPPSCPAKFRHWRLNGEPPDETYELGTAAHALVLQGEDIVAVVEAADWRTKAAQTERDKIRAAGRIPLLPAALETVQSMAEALWHHPEARALLDPGTGTPEQSLFWYDDQTGVQRKARLDWLPKPTGYLINIPEYKTTVAADRASIMNAMWRYGYIMQAAAQIEGVEALKPDYAGLVDVTFIFQEKTPPYVVTLARLEPDALAMGVALNRKAIDEYWACSTTDHWPAYSDETITVGVPRWAEKELESRL